MIHRISMMKPLHLVLLLALVIVVPIVAQDESEVAVVPDTDSIPDLILKPGDIAPSWALMYAPAKFEFLKNWTVKRGAKLRKFKSQPNRHVVVVSFFAT